MRSPHDPTCSRGPRCCSLLAARATSSVDGNSDVSPSIRLQRVAACRDDRKLRNNLHSAKPRTRVVSACSLYLQPAPCHSVPPDAAAPQPHAHAHQPSLYLARINLRTFAAVHLPPPLYAAHQPSL
eukprot:scaffold69472_cov40-Phaeocystis_antarctica.AAC.3